MTERTLYAATVARGKGDGSSYRDAISYRALKESGILGPGVELICDPQPGATFLHLPQARRDD